MAITPDTPIEAVPTPEQIVPLFEPLQYGQHELRTRIVYAPLTRCRAEVDGIQPDFAAQYYTGV
jgi:2,4-dienoyl-CoA reductase-like NADH-dependent reductase (Old Yellow Enzyme family)